MLDFVNLDHFPVLRFLYGTGRTRGKVLLRLIIIFSALHLLGTAVALWEGAFYIREPRREVVSASCPCDSAHAVMDDSYVQKAAVWASIAQAQPIETKRANSFVGYGADLANHLYYVAFIISFFLVWSLIEKFNQVFVRQHATSAGLAPLLDEDRLDDVQRRRYEQCVDEQVQMITLQGGRSRRWFTILWILGVFGYILFAIIYPIQSGQITGCKTWNFCFDRFPLMYFFGQFKDILVNIVFAPSVICMTVSITVAARRIVRFGAKEGLFTIVPLSPDGAGGLTPLGRLSLVLFYIVIVQLLYIVPTTLNLGFHIGYQILYPCFFAFAAFVFFWPLSAARGPMKRAKELEMERLAHLVNLSYENLKHGLHVDSSGRIKGVDTLEHLEKLRQLYRDVRRMPVWPYDFTTLTRFSSIFAIPVIAFVLQMVFSTDSIFYRPEQLADLLEKISSWAGR